MLGDIPDPQSHRNSDSFDYILDCARRNDVAGVHDIVAKGCPPTFANRVGQSALHIAAIWGSADAVKVLLQLKADPCAQNDKRRATPLHVAASGRGPSDRRAECIRLLIDGKGDPGMRDYAGDKAVDLADDDELRVALGEVPLILHQVVAGKEANYLERVIKSIQSGHLPGVDLNGKDAAGLTALHYAVHIDWHKGVELLSAAGAAVCTQAYDGEAPLHLAVQHGNIETVKQLLEMKASPNIKNQDPDVDPRYKSTSFDQNPNEHMTPLHYAAQLGSVRAIQLLIQAQADPNALDSLKQSPLHLTLPLQRDDTQLELGRGVRIVGTKKAELNDCLGAVVGEMIAEGHYHPPRWPVQVTGTDGKGFLFKRENLETLADETLDILLGARADVNLGNHCIGESRTLLHDAAYHGDAKVVAVLLEANAALDQQDKAGLSALHVAARSKHCDVIKLLVSARADLKLKTAAGKTAAELAIKNSCEPSVLALLHGEKAAEGTIYGDCSKGVTLESLTAEQRAALFID